MNQTERNPVDVQQLEELRITLSVATKTANDKLAAANEEIKRMKKANEYWHKVVGFNKTDTDTLNDKLTAERESKVAARGEVDRLRKQIGALNLDVSNISRDFGTANAKLEKLREAIIQHSKFCDLHFSDAIADTESKE